MTQVHLYVLLFYFFSFHADATAEFGVLCFIIKHHTMSTPREVTAFQLTPDPDARDIWLIRFSHDLFMLAMFRREQHFSWAFSEPSGIEYLWGSDWLDEPLKQINVFAYATLGSTLETLREALKHKEPCARYNIPQRVLNGVGSRFFELSQEDYKIFRHMSGVQHWWWPTLRRRWRMSPVLRNKQRMLYTCIVLVLVYVTWAIVKLLF